MAKKDKNLKSMADVTIEGMTTKGKGYVESKLKRDGEYVGVDIDCERMRSGHNYGAKKPPTKAGAKQGLMSGKNPAFLDSTAKKMG